MRVPASLAADSMLAPCWVKERDLSDLLMCGSAFVLRLLFACECLYVRSDLLCWCILVYNTPFHKLAHCHFFVNCNTFVKLKKK